jgi:hypothetical protein
MTTVELTILLFNAINCMRMFAYVPQITAIVRDHHGAEAVSCLTWTLFALAHLSTVVYGWLVARDICMVFVFAVNFLACVLIIGLTAYKRIATPHLQTE